MKTTLYFLWLTGLSVSLAQAQPKLTADQQAVLTALDAKTAHYGAISRQIWDWAELGYQEVKSLEEVGVIFRL